MTVENGEVETYLQRENYDCGIGAVATVLKILKCRVNYANLSSALEVSRTNGTRVTNIENYFANRGFPILSKSGAYIEDLRRELEKKRPIIIAYQGSGTKREMAKFEGGHYSVINKITERNVYLLDPGVVEDFGDGVGRQIIPIPEFRERWVDIDKERGKRILYVHWMLSVGKPRKYANI